MISEHCFLNVRLEISVLHGHVGVPKVGILKSLRGSIAHALPLNQRLLATLVRGERQLVVGETIGEVLDQRSTVAQLRIVDVLGLHGGESTVTRPGNAKELGVGAVLGQPDYDALPLMAVTASGGAVGGLVLGHVPGVHDGVLVIPVLAAAVDLAFAAVTVTTGGAGVFETIA